MAQTAPKLRLVEAPSTGYARDAWLSHVIATAPAAIGPRELHLLGEMLRLVGDATGWLEASYQKLAWRTRLSERTVRRAAKALAAAGLIAPVCYAIASTYTKAFPSTTTPFANTQGSMWMAGLVCLPVLFFVPIRHAPQLGDWAALAALGVFCTGIAYLMYFRLIQDVGPTKALSVTFLIPVFGVLWGALFLNESIGWDKLSGGVLVLAGISLTTGIVKLPSRKSA